MTPTRSPNPELRKLPGVDRLLALPQVSTLAATFGRPLVTGAVRQAIEAARHDIVAGNPAPDADQLALQIEARVRRIAEPSLRPVINATGIVLHTNLGRAPLGGALLREITACLAGYTNLEFDLGQACRGSRADHIAELICWCTGAEDGIVVNNNAAAVMLALHTLARGREVLVSRGELIEIGGSFRIPEIMEASGAVMREVGTTNRTHLQDYERAITSDTAIIFKAHTSNYRITGFTAQPPAAELATLARAHGLLFVHDIGSGLLRRPQNLDLAAEPDIRHALADGADLVTFSCDKLLGGPQAGIAAGAHAVVSRLARTPMMRALRVGKLTIAALQATLRQYLSDDAPPAGIPVCTMLERPLDAVAELAAALQQQLASRGIAARTGESQGQCGGGAVPDVRIPSVAVILDDSGRDLPGGRTLAEKRYLDLLQADPPVLGVLRKGRLLFDMLTVSTEDIPAMAAAITAACSALDHP